MLGRFIALSALILSTSLFAEPRQWDTNGIPVRAVRAIDDYSSVSREDGTTLIVWSQSAGSEPVILGQLLSPDGTPQWEAGGRLLAQGLYRAAYPVVASVDGGWAIAWNDALVLGWGDIADGGWVVNATLRALKIDDSGAPVWSGGRAGIEVVPLTQWWNIKDYAIYASGEGAMVTWNIEYQRHVQRLTATGEFAWPDNIVIGPPWSYYSAGVTSDDFGGLIYVNQVIQSNDTMLQANRLLPNGTLAWNDTNNVVVATDDAYFGETKICPDGTGGAYVAWIPNGAEPARAQRVSAQGQVLWPTAGVSFSNLTFVPELKAIATSFLDGEPDGMLATMQGEDNGSVNYLIAQKISSTGALQWGDNGESVCSGNVNEIYANKTTIVSDHHGGAICHYNRQQSIPEYTYDAVVSRVAADGSRPWNDNCGVVVGSESYYLQEITDAFVSADAVTVSWLGTYQTLDNIRVQRVNLSTGQIELPEILEIGVGDPAGTQNLQAVKLSGGSTALIWQASGSNNYSQYFQILDVFGHPLFDNRGRPLGIIANVPVNGEKAGVCADESGGFFAAFQSIVDGTYRIRAVHVNGQGEYISATGGEIVQPEGNWYDVTRIVCLADGLGGCYITAGIYNSDYYLQTVVMHVNAQCQLTWEHAVLFTDQTREVYPLNLSPSQESSCILTYMPTVYGDSKIHAAGISPFGVVNWDVIVQDSMYFYTYYNDVAACSDSRQGSYILWRGMNDAQNRYELFGQRVSPTGELLWGHSRTIYSDSSGKANNISCAADQIGNLTVAWANYNTDADIYAQRISPDGNLLWPQNGLSVSQAPFDQSSPVVVPISDNEVYITWIDYRVSNQQFWDGDIYGTHLNARGQIRDDSYWQADGSPICNYNYYQNYPVMIADGAGGALVAWQDQRTGYDWLGSIFAQRLYDPIFTDAEEKPVVPTEFSLSQNYPNPFNPETNIEFTLPNTVNTSLKVFDVTGRLVTTLVDETMTAGTHRINFDGSRLASGVYFYSLKAGSNVSTRKMVMLK